MRSSLLLLLCGLALGLAACSATGTTSVAPAAGAAMDDATLLHVFITSNRGEIVTSDPVRDDLQNADVRAYAQMMVTEHSGVIDRATATGQTAGVTPRDNPISMAMTQQAAGIARELEGLPDPQVDVRYLEHQIALHGNTLSMLDHVLIPNADHDAIQSLFEQARPAVRQHMERAMALHHQMMASNR